MSARISFINQRLPSFARTLNISGLSWGDQVLFPCREIKKGRIGKSDSRFCVKRLSPPSLLCNEISFFIIVAILGAGQHEKGLEIKK